MPLDGAELAGRHKQLRLVVLAHFHPDVHKGAVVAELNIPELVVPNKKSRKTIPFVSYGTCAGPADAWRTRDGGA